MPVLVVGEATAPATAGADVLLVPVGSVEQHGPHLPLATDGLIARAVCDGVAARLADEGARPAVAPVVEYGASGEHEAFPGTISIGHEALTMVLVELARSATRWVERIVLVSGHGGNVPALTAAGRLLRSESRDVTWTTCAEPGWDAHAGFAETSLMLAIAPHLVRMDHAVAGPTTPVEQLWPALRLGGVIAVSRNGVLGDPTGARADRGHALLTTLVTRLVAQIRESNSDASGALPRPDPHREEAS